MLDLARLAPQVKEFILQQQAAAPNLMRESDAAVAAFEASLSDAGELAAQVRALRSSRLIAQPIPGLSTISPLPPRPNKYTAVAVDGSQIAPDRHDFTQCYLINIGSVLLHYGSGERARLSSSPKLFFSDEDLYEEDDSDLRLLSAQGLAIRRQEMEGAAMTAALEEIGPRTDTPIALMDGTLILWTLEAESSTVRARALKEFESLLNMAHGLQLPIAGYISRPGSRDVTNLLRAWQCGFENAPCGLKCTSRNLLKIGEPCEDLQEITDGTLFARLLKQGERSPVYLSKSRVLHQLSPQNRIAFYYFHTGLEIARVEVPNWVMEDENLLNRSHSLIYDQVWKGEGYPRALTEAHELAVVRGPEKSQFLRALEKAFVSTHFPVEITRKAMSKRTRGV